MMEDYTNVMEDSYRYSYYGQCILGGDVAVIKSLYEIIWREAPVLVKMLSMLQNIITADEIEKDTKGLYCPEFLYYWGMICIGEQSRLIPKDLGTAEICLKKICKIVPKAEARLAYIELLKSDEPAKSELNVERINVLRIWAGKKDIFSNIALAKIVFHQFLCECLGDFMEPPIRVLRLLDYPCQKGHPVAIRFYNSVMEYIGTPEAMQMCIDERYILPGCLWDFEMSANMQIGHQTL